MKKFITTSVLFILVTVLQAFPQMESIKEFPRAYASQEIFDLTPVWISNNEILVFYKNSTRGHNIFQKNYVTLGKPGANQKFEQAGEGINAFYYDMYLFKTSTGRLLFFYVSTNYGINCYFSDNNGIGWVEATQITEFSFTDLSVTEIEPDKIILSFST